MDSGTVARRQTTVLVALVIAIPVMFWGSADGFGVPKWTLLMAGSLGLSVLLVQRYLLPEPWPIHAGWGLLIGGAVVMAALVATVTSDAPLVSFVGAYSFYQGSSTFLALGVIVLTVLSLRHDFTEIFLGAAAIAAGLVALITAGQLVGVNLFEFDTQGFGTVPTTLGNTNFGAAYLGLSLPAALYQVLAPSRPPIARQLGTLLAVVLVIEVLVLGSVQGPITALAAGGSFIALWSIQRHGPRRTVQASVALALLGVVAITAFREAIWSELLTSAQAGRYGAWVSAWRMFRDNPILGVGLDRYENQYPAYRPARAAVEEAFTNAGQAHNVVLDLMADGGLVLASLYVAMVAYTAYKAYRGVRRAHASEDRRRYFLLAAVISIWIGYQIQSLVSIDLVPLALMHWLSMALIFRLSTTQEGVPAAVVASPATSRSMRRSASAVVTVAALIALVVALIPLRADMAAGEARRLLEEGQPAEAERKATRATSLVGYRSEYWIRRGLVAQATLGAERALPFMLRGAELAEGNSRVALLVAQYFASVGDEDQATTWFAEALARDPRNPTILEQAAAFYEEVGEPERAQALNQRRETALSADRPAPESRDHWLASNPSRGQSR